MYIIPDADGKTIRTIIQNKDGEGAITISFTDGSYLVIGADLRVLREPKRPLGTVSSTPMISVVLDAALYPMERPAIKKFKLADFPMLP
jgi:hypothetical protein